MKKGTRQRILLIVLSALLLGSAWRYFLSISGPEGNGDSPMPASAGATMRELHPGTEVASLHLTSLDAARPSSAAGRDPWRFQDPAPRNLPPREAEPISVPPPRQPPVSPHPAAMPSEPTLEYLGRFGPPDRKIAVLSDGKRTFNALEGEVIEGRLVVERIGYEAVEIRLLRAPGGPTQRLGLRSLHAAAPP